jgi:hypothetical protein
MGDEIPRSVAGNIADDGALCRALDPEAGARAELRDRHNHWTGDAAG